MTRKLKKVIREDFGAFVQKLELLPPPQPAPPKAPHPLTGLSFAVSDAFDIEGFVTGFGNLDWARTHEVASRTASVISFLIEGGAKCVGKTVIDEMAYSIGGENKDYGTPTNPKSPSLSPGGSSSGAAVAVAANIVDFSLGIDTVGGVRVPAAFCGILGFRPSHGVISHMGVVPVSASLDSVGLFAKDPDTLRRVGHVLLQLPFAVQRNPRQIIVADDCYQLPNLPFSGVSQLVIKSTEKLFGRQVLKHENLESFLNSEVPSLKAFHNKKRNGALKSSSLKALASTIQFLQREEFKHNHEEWINSVKPRLDPIILANMHEIVEMADKEIEICKSIKNEIHTALSSLIRDDGILVIPTVVDPPPKLGGKEISSEEYRSRAFSLLGIASMSGCCQVTIPLGFHEKCPVSVSFMAKRGSDRFLLDTVQTMYKTLTELADLAATSTLSRNANSKEHLAEIAKEKGNQAYKDKQWQKAVGFYTDAIKLSSSNATYYSNRAAAYLELGSFLQAEADSTKAINLDKKNIKSYLRRGTARELLGYYKEATEDFNSALVLEPTNKRASESYHRLRQLFQ